ncbi:MAG: SMP-30/gluconolactonase/LRE family protein [Alphaproteobacteria bacterium]|nr:SMP-30/gluconolactonase/LRE family protein [Alphaproteobacteria bacterium]
MRVETPKVESLVDFPLGTGEGPCWDSVNGMLYFIDIPAPALFRLDPKTRRIDRFEMPSTIGSFGLAADGRAIVALRSGVHMFDFASGRFEFVVNPEPDKPANRLNDGKVGPDGRFWVGSMDDRPEKEPVAALYRIDISGRATKMLDGLTVSNGLAWSPNGKVLYHSDSRQRFVQTFDYASATGEISNRKVIRTLEEGDGRPDGAAMDCEGFYWSAGVSAGCLNRIAPDGTIDRKVMLPVASPTMPCFGGDDLRTLYVTSLATDRTGVRQAGTLITFRVDVAGAPIGRFGAHA